MNLSIVDQSGETVRLDQQCLICCEPTDASSSLKLRSCSHIWCYSCIFKRFSAAIEAESNYPVICCEPQTSVELSSAVDSVIGRYMAGRFFAKKLEYDTQDKTYCHVPTCSTFINPSTIIEHLAKCESCKADTCSKCKIAYHGDIPCDNAKKDDEQFQAWCEDKKTKACPKCDRVVEKSSGCNHIKCICGQEFCYTCGKGWRPRTCTCPQHTGVEGLPEGLGDFYIADALERRRRAQERLRFAQEHVNRHIGIPVAPELLTEAEIALRRQRREAEQTANVQNALRDVERAQNNIAREQTLLTELEARLREFTNRPILSNSNLLQHQTELVRLQQIQHELAVARHAQAAVRVQRLLELPALAPGSPPLGRALPRARVMPTANAMPYLAPPPIGPPRLSYRLDRFNPARQTRPSPLPPLRPTEPAAVSAITATSDEPQWNLPRDLRIASSRMARRGLERHPIHGRGLQLLLGVAHGFDEPREQSQQPTRPSQANDVHDEAYWQQMLTAGASPTTVQMIRAAEVARATIPGATLPVSTPQLTPLPAPTYAPRTASRSSIRTNPSDASSNENEEEERRPIHALLRRTSSLALSLANEAPGTETPVPASFGSAQGSDSLPTLFAFGTYGSIPAPAVRQALPPRPNQPKPSNHAALTGLRRPAQRKETQTPVEAPARNPTSINYMPSSQQHLNFGYSGEIPTCDGLTVSPRPRPDFRTETPHPGAYSREFGDNFIPFEPQPTFSFRRPVTYSPDPMFGNPSPKSTNITNSTMLHTSTRAIEPCSGHKHDLSTEPNTRGHQSPCVMCSDDVGGIWQCLKCGTWVCRACRQMLVAEAKK